MYEEKINAYFDAPERRAELVEAISRLVRIRSVREEPLPGKIGRASCRERVYQLV